MRDDRDYKVELSSEAGGGPNGQGNAASVRPFVSVQFDCCNVYLRIYRSADGTAYRGNCPRCGLPVNFVVGEGGTDVRFFRVK